MSEKPNCLVVIFPAPFIRDKIKEAGFAETKRNVSLILQTIKQALSDEQMVSRMIKEAIELRIQSLDKPLEIDNIKEKELIYGN